MRLPWLRVDQDAFARSRSLGGYLSVHRRYAMGLMMDLWAWAVEMTPEGSDITGCFEDPDPQETLVGALEWEGDRAKLLGGLVRAGLVELIDGGFRVRGMSRYLEALEKLEKDRRRKANARRNGQSADGPRKSGDQTQTQTQTHIEATSGNAIEQAFTALPADRRNPNTRAISDAMCQEFLAIRGDKYLFQGAKDAVALKALASQFTPEEILRRWTKGLRCADWRRLSSIASLRAKWNDLGDDPPPRTFPGKPQPPPKPALPTFNDDEDPYATKPPKP